MGLYHRLDLHYHKSVGGLAYLQLMTPPHCNQI